MERRHIQRVLVMTKGNKSAAARILEVSRPTLNRMIKDYGHRGSVSACKLPLRGAWNGSLQIRRGRKSDRYRVSD